MTHVLPKERRPYRKTGSRYIDGVKCDELKGGAAELENGPMQIIMDLMVAHSWQQQWGVTLQDITLVRQLELDYIRVYQLASTAPGSRPGFDRLTR